jgi:AAA domain
VAHDPETRQAYGWLDERYGGGRNDAGPSEAEAAPGAMRFYDLSELRNRVSARAGGFLIEPLWPEDAYGVQGAEDKAGKTWATVDLGVSVATGTKWQGHYACLQGRALVLYGEGGDRNLLRRLDAVARSKGIDPRELDAANVIRVALSVPRLDRPDQIDAVARELDSFGPRVILLDPLYLAAGGGKGRDLYAMGESLQAIQTICQEAGTALVVTTHWNLTGEGSGARRFTGVGPSAWGRVLASAEVEQRHTDPDGRSMVTLRWDVTGGEIADTQFRTRRRVWVDDPADLSSAMHYEVEVTAEGDDVVRLSPSQDRILDVLKGGGRWSVQEVGDELAKDGRGHPLKKRTIQDALKKLAEQGLADGEGDEGEKGTWWAA